MSTNARQISGDPKYTDPASMVMAQMNDDDRFEGMGYFMRVTLRNGKQFCGAAYPSANGLLVLDVPNPDMGGDRYPVAIRLDEIAAAEVEP